MTTRTCRVAHLALILFIAASCASGGSPATATAGNQTDMVPPRMLNNTGPVMQMPGRFTGAIELAIDVNGRPDFLSMKVMGRMTDEVRRAFIEYFRQSTFAPATINGVPVPGVYKIRFR